MVENNSTRIFVADEPVTFSAATKGEQSASWKAAIKTEIDALAANKAWTLVPRTEANNILTSNGYSRRKKSFNQLVKSLRSIAPAL